VSFDARIVGSQFFGHWGRDALVAFWSDRGGGTAAPDVPRQSTKSARNVQKLRCARTLCSVVSDRPTSPAARWLLPLGALGSLLPWTPPWAALVAGAGLDRAAMAAVGFRPFLLGVLLWLAVIAGSLAGILTGWIR